MNMDIDQARQDKIVAVIDGLITAARFWGVGSGTDKADPVIVDNDGLVIRRRLAQPVEQFAATQMCTPSMPL